VYLTYSAAFASLADSCTFGVWTTFAFDLTFKMLQVFSHHTASFASYVLQAIALASDQAKKIGEMPYVQRQAPDLVVALYGKT
jgi:hypothetical protein